MIPTKQDFHEVLKRFRECSLTEIIPEIQLEYFRSPENEAARLLLGRALSLLREKYHFALQHDAFVWIDSQSCFWSAATKVLGRPKSVSPADRAARDERVIDLWMRRLSKYIEKRERSGELSGDRQFGRHVEWMVVHENGTMIWYMTLVSSLVEYHYGETAARMPLNRRDFRNNLRRAIEGLEALSIIADDDSLQRVFDQFGSGLRPNFMNSHFVMGHISALQALSELDEDDIYPIHRSDATVNERLFVYRMSRANWRVARSNKSDAIVDLLQLKGFKSRMDVRTIERMCSKFRESRKRLTASIDSINGSRSIQ